MVCPGNRTGQCVATAAMEAGVASDRGAPWRRAASRLPRWWPYALIALVTLLIRLPTIGNPILDFDEQLYLLVGDGMWHGQLPYVDMWDRKPLGLFAFYAAIRLLGGDGIVQYQLVAGACVAITACLIRAMARRHASETAAVVVAIAYVLTLNVLHGAGGQAAVIYNALTAFAVWCAFNANDEERAVAVARQALAAMLAMGIAIQFKYTPVIEGMFLGCWFLWRFWRLGVAPTRVVALATAMVLAALAPTALAIGCYVANGHLDDYIYANFVSIFRRLPFSAQVRHDQAMTIIAMAGGLIATGLWGLWQGRKRLHDTARSDFWLLAGWVASAFAGFALLGDFFDFYFITVALPLALASAGAVRRGPHGFAAACLLLLWPALGTPAYYFLRGHYQHATARMVARIQPYVVGHPLYVYDGPAVLYLLTKAQAPTRYIYPDHLNNPVEAMALGVDPVVEEQRVLAARPGAIVTASRPVVPHVAPGTQALVRAALARDYVLVDRVPTFDRTFFIWARRDLHPGPAPIHDPRADNPQ